MPVVTIARLYGTGGRQVGLETARLLGADYVDKEIIAEAARRLGMSEEQLQEHDERLVSMRERITGAFRSFLERSAAASITGDPFVGVAGPEILANPGYDFLATASQTGEAGTVDERRYRDALVAVIKDIARSNNVVIVGRGSQAILRNHPGALHVFIIASFDERVRTVKAEEGVDRATAEHRIREVDRARQAFMKRFFNIDRDDPFLYDLTVNMERISLDQAAGLIAAAAGIQSQSKAG